MTQIEALLGFLGEAVTPFHAVAAMSLQLQDAGFEAVSYTHLTLPTKA